MSAHLSGDKEAKQAAEDKLAEGIKAKFSLSDTLEAMAAAGLMTAVTGGVGAVGTSIKGEQIKNTFAQVNGEDNAAKSITKIAKGLSDKEMAARASAMYDYASQGKDLSYEQYVELGNAIAKQRNENAQKAKSAHSVGMETAKKESFFAVPGVGVSNNGNYVFGESYQLPDGKGGYVTIVDSDSVTNKEAEQSRVELYKIADQIENEMGTSIEDKDNFIEELVAAEYGYANESVVEYLTDAFPENRAIYEMFTGETLPSDNAKMRDAVYQRSSLNFVKTAERETIDTIDRNKGFLDVQFANTIGSEGQHTFQALSENIGVEDTEKYTHYANVMGKVYEAGRNELPLETVLKFADVNQIAEEDVKLMYEAGKADGINPNQPTVKFDISKGTAIRNSHRDTLLAFSRIFGVNIVVTDKLTVDKANKIKNKQSIEESDNVGAQVNGMFYDNTIYINLNDDIHKPIGYTIMHELTHGIRQMFPEDYNTFAKLFKERWIDKNDEESFNKAIQSKIDAYAKHNVTLKEADALEEIICDQMAEVLYDEQFMQNIAENHPSLAQSLLYAIQDVIRKIRQLFANYGGFRSEFNEATLSQLDMLKDAETLLMKAINAAQDGRTQEILNENSGAKYSIVDIVGVSGKNYGRGVYFNSRNFDGMDDNAAKEEVKSIIKSLNGVTFTAFEPDGTMTELTLVGHAKNGKNHADNDLRRKNNNSKEKRQAIALIDEVLLTATHTGADTPSRKSHGWVDNYGKSQWEKWDAYGLDDDGQIWLIPLQITTNDKGEKVLYDVEKPKKEERVETNHSSSKQILYSYEEEFKRKRDEIYNNAVNSGDRRKAQQMVVEAADRAMPDSLIREGFAVNSGEFEDGELVPMLHGSGAANFNVFNIPDYEGALGKGAYFTSVFEEACDYAISELGIEENEDGLYEWDGDTYDYGSLCEELESKGYVRPFYLNITEENDYDDSKYGNGGIIAVARSANQIKSADPVTYDDNGDVITLSERFNPNTNDIRFSIDSEGNELSLQQSEYFKDSKVRDEEGNLIPVYHGTNDAGFTEFKRTNNFYTDSKEVAGTYTKTGGIYEGYLNITNPLVIDCNNERWSRIEFDQIDPKVADLFAEYGGSTFEEDGAERTSTADIVSVVEDGIDDGILDYDGIILKNIYDEGMYGDYKSGSLLSNVYITFNSNQFKNRDNLEPTESQDIRFSMDAPYEETKDLIAVHNLKEDDIRGLQGLGGMPMPSIAIIKAAQGHNMYGDYSFVFDKTTIDPKRNKANKVYGGDAWTPTFPRIDYEVVRDSAFDDFQKKISALRDGAPESVRRVLNRLAQPDTLADKLGGNNGVDGLKESLLDDTDMKNAFLNTKGEYVDTIYTKTEKTMPDGEFNYLNAIIDSLGTDVISEFSVAGLPTVDAKKKHRQDYAEKYSNEIREAIAVGLNFDGTFSKEKALEIVDSMNTQERLLEIRHAFNLYTNGRTQVEEKADYQATRDEIDKRVDNIEYRKWLDDLFGGLSIESGLYNGKDPFTPSGKRRSFKQTHMPATLENIVKAMKLKENGETVLGDNFKAVAQKEFSSIKDIKSDSNRLQNIDEAEYEKLNDELAKRESDIISSFFERADISSYDNEFIVRDSIRSSVTDSIRNSKSKADILKKLKDYYYTQTATEEDAAAVWKLAQDTANLPTGYFEAKPERAVTFDEVKTVIAPDNAPSDIMQFFEDVGVDVVQYENGNDADRTEKLNSLENMKFSIGNEFSTSGLPTVKLSKRDYAIIRHEVIRKNALILNADTHMIDFAFTDSKFILYETWGDDSFRPFLSLYINKNEEFIKEIRDELKQDTQDFDSIVESVRNRRRRNSRNSAYAKGRSGRTKDDSVDRRESNSKQESDIRESGKDSSETGSVKLSISNNQTPAPLSEVIPSKDDVMKFSFMNPLDTSWFDGDLGEETVNPRGGRNKSISEITAEFTNIIRDNAKLTGGKILDKKSIKKQIGELVKMTTKDTTYTATEKREIANFLMDTAEQIWSITGEKRPMKLKQEEIDRIINLLYEASDYVISNAQYLNDSMLNEIIEFKKFFRGREVGVSEGARAELADDWNTIRKRNLGRVRFVSSEKYGVTNIADALYETFPETPEISLLYGREVEEAMEIGDEATLVRILDDVLSNLSVIDDAIKSEYAEDFRVALSQDFARIVLNEGEAWNSKMDRFKDRYEQRIKDLRARQKEAVRDMRNNYEKLLAEQNATFKQKLAETKAKGEARLQEEKAKNKAKEQKRKASEQHKQIWGRISKDYKWLADRLVNGKKDDFKHIPSDFVESVANLLEIFDFQTERSLKLEEKRGYASEPTKAMRELRDKISKYSSPDSVKT